MKRIAPILLLAAVTLATTACKEEKKPADIVATIEPKPKKPAAPQKREEAHTSEVVDWLGGKYTVSIDRVPDSTLVTDDTGERYYDNRATLRVTRADGSTFVDKTFRKTDFLKAAKGQFADHGVFLGMVFDRVDGKTLVFGASIGAPSPDSDEFVPLSITVDNMGGVTIAESSIGVKEEAPV